MEKIKCTIERITFQNPENGYSVLQTTIKGYREEQTVVGIFHEVTVGAVLTVEGNWRVDKRYGRQFAAEKWTEELPADIIGIEFIEKAYHNQWMRFYELFDVQMTDREADLDRARNKLHGLIETMTYVLQQAKQQGKTDKKAEYFTEKELPQLNGTFIQFLEWAKSDEFWSVRKKDERQRAAEIKAEMLKEQKEIIRLIKECEYRAEEELQIAQTVLNNIETKL